MVFAAALTATSALAQSPGLGTAASVQEIHAADVTIMPNGEGLPAGSGNATAGAGVYQSHCTSCHGERGIGGVNDVLAGGRGSLATTTPLKTIGSYWPYATTLFDYVRRAMPYWTPGALSDSDAYAVTAYLLYINGIIDERVEINAASLPSVRMPNQDNFRWAIDL
jgi:cytochrome c